MSDENNFLSEEIGIPKANRVKRRYTLSARALEQRRQASQAPKPGMQGKRNAWKHGQYAASMLTRIKPCLSTCAKYPCRLVDDGHTEPGKDCLDAEELLTIIHAVHDALSNPDDTGRFAEIAAVNIGNSIRILEMLQEDILRDGPTVKSVKPGKFGDVVEYRPHPALLSLPKLIQELNMTPEQFMMTPKAQLKQKTEDEAVKGLTDILKTAGAMFNQDKGD